LEFKEVSFGEKVLYDLDDETLKKFRTIQGLLDINRAIFYSEPNSKSLDDYLETIIEMDAGFEKLLLLYNINGLKKSYIDFNKKILVVGD